ncbi:MAG: MMPL family transporter [Lachnospiraceae bacterium]|jgi:predicted RND superfamily exporter protein|nr:MMPL family transporter [Lachnospiraceae bacterium]
MEKFGRKVVQLRIPILILSLVLLIPSFLGYVSTRVNYDILSYLPKDIETMVGQDILVDEFGTGAFSMFVVEGMEPREIAGLKADIEQVEHVEKVIWYDSVMDISVPMEMVPDELYEAFNSGEATMMAIIFNETTSADGTMEAIENIRKVADRNCFLSGMSAVVTDTKNLSEREAPIYVGIAVLLSCLVLSVTMDSFLIPFLFLASIGMAIVYNLGSNFFMGEISYITKALSAVLQLGVTMDYSIFLWHSYQEKNAQMPDKKEAMAGAIADTVTSVVSSSMTTVAGFIALCFMSFTLGMDLGIVMAKGVVIGVIACITVLPSMILVFDKALKKTKHKALLPDMNGIGAFVTRHYGIFIALFVALLFPALFGYKNTKVYYNLDETLPKDLPSIVANDKLNESFDMNATHMLLLSADLADKDVQHMTEDMKKVDGVNWVLGLSVVKGAAIPAEFIPSDLTDSLENENWQLLLIGSQYKVASEEVNRQCERLSEICKSYDDKGMLVGEAPCTKDLIEITDKDFGTVSVVSIGVIFIIIMLVFKSISLPAILVSVIEMAIFINMGIPYYTGTEIPFIASVVIGTIQLGATVDYAILMTTRYRRERFEGMEKKEAVAIACQSSVKSILVSALSFFAATFGVGLYSNIDMISSLCTLMARGALISMVSVIFTLPSMFMVFDRLIMKSGLKNKKRKNHSIGQEAVSL